MISKYMLNCMLYHTRVRVHFVCYMFGVDMM